MIITARVHNYKMKYPKSNMNYFTTFSFNSWQKYRVASPKYPMPGSHSGLIILFFIKFHRISKISYHFFKIFPRKNPEFW